MMLCVMNYFAVFIRDVSILGKCLYLDCFSFYWHFRFLGVTLVLAVQVSEC
jgi:hypothetical protein